MCSTQICSIWMKRVPPPLLWVANCANPAPGSTALVIGAGTVGLLIAAMVRKSGCTDVTIADIDAGRVNYAVAKGYKTHGYVTAKSLARDILSLSAPSQDSDDDPGVDMTFECTGKEICMQTAIYASRPGGKVIVVGMGTPIQTLPLSAAHLREVDILGIFRYANTYATGIRLLSAGCLPNLDDMVTHRFKGLGSAQALFELAGRTVDDDGKLVLKVVFEA